MDSSAPADARGNRKRGAARGVAQEPAAKPGRRPPKKVQDGLVINATEAEMNKLDQLVYNTLRIQMQCGAVQVRPPEGFPHPQVRMDEDSIFHVREQPVPAKPLAGGKIVHSETWESSEEPVTLREYKRYRDEVEAEVGFEPDLSSFRAPLSKKAKATLLRNEKRFLDMVKYGVLPESGAGGPRKPGVLLYGVDVEAEGGYNAADNTYLGYSANNAGYKEADPSSAGVRVSSIQTAKAKLRGATRSREQGSTSKATQEEGLRGGTNAQLSSNVTLHNAHNEHNESFTESYESNPRAESQKELATPSQSERVHANPQLRESPNALPTAQDTASVYLSSIQNATPVAGATTGDDATGSSSSAVNGIQGGELRSDETDLPPAGCAQTRGVERQSQGGFLAPSGHATHANQSPYRASGRNVPGAGSSASAPTPQPLPAANQTASSPLNNSIASPVPGHAFNKSRPGSYRIGPVHVGSSRPSGLTPAIMQTGLVSGKSTQPTRNGVTRRLKVSFEANYAQTTLDSRPSSRTQSNAGASRTLTRTDSAPMEDEPSASPQPAKPNSAVIEETVLDDSSRIPNDIGNPQEADVEEEVIDEGGPDDDFEEATPPVPRNPPSHIGNINKLGCLRHLPPAPGITIPMYYLGVMGTIFGIHVEDLCLTSISIMHKGSAAKVWYTIPPEEVTYLIAYCKEKVYHKDITKTDEEVMYRLSCKTTILDPYDLAEYGITVYRHIHVAGNLIITAPRGYHWGFNTGWNMAEAVNFANPDWLPIGSEATERLRKIKQKPTFSMEYIVYHMANEMCKKVAKEGVSKIRENPREIEAAGYIGTELKKIFDEGEAALRAYRDEHGVTVFMIDQFQEGTIKELERGLGHSGGVQCKFCTGFAHFLFLTCADCKNKDAHLCWRHFDRGLCRKKGHAGRILVRRHDPDRILTMIETLDEVAGIEKDYKKFHDRFMSIARPCNYHHKSEPGARRLKLRFSNVAVQKEAADALDAEEDEEELSLLQKAEKLTSSKRKRTIDEEAYVPNEDEEMKDDDDEEVDADYSPSDSSCKAVSKTKKRVRRELDKAAPSKAKKVKRDTRAKKQRTKPQESEPEEDVILPVKNSTRVPIGNPVRKKQVRERTQAGALQKRERGMENPRDLESDPASVSEANDGADIDDAVMDLLPPPDEPTSKRELESGDGGENERSSKRQKTDEEVNDQEKVPSNAKPADANPVDAPKTPGPGIRRSTRRATPKIDHDYVYDEKDYNKLTYKSSMETNSDDEDNSDAEKNNAEQQQQGEQPASGNRASPMTSFLNADGGETDKDDNPAQDA